MKAKINSDQVSMIALFIYFVMFLNPDYTTSNLSYYTPYVLCGVALSLQIVLSGKVCINTYVKWRIIMIIWCIASCLWLSSDRAISFLYVKLFILHSLVLMLIIQMFRRVGFFSIIKIFSVAVFLTGIYIILNVDFSTILYFRLGRDVIGERWNANSVGLMATYTFLLIKLAEKNSGKLIYENKLFRGILLSLLIIMTVLSGSRKAIIVFVIGAFIFYIINSKDSRKTFFRIIVAIILVILGFALLMYIPFLYNILGSRLVHIFDFINQGTIEDESIQWRALMIQYAVKFFKEKPILGYGINGFRIEFGKYFSNYATYAHNNFMELLVDGGVVAFTLYYSIVGIIWKAFKKSKCIVKREVLVLFIILLVMDYAVVSYIDFNIQFYICILFECLLYEKDNKPMFNSKISKGWHK